MKETDIQTYLKNNIGQALLKAADTNVEALAAEIAHVFAQAKLLHHTHDALHKHICLDSLNVVKAALLKGNVAQSIELEYDAGITEARQTSENYFTKSVTTFERGWQALKAATRGAIEGRA